jgi:hypothetical protein
VYNLKYRKSEEYNIISPSRLGVFEEGLFFYFSYDFSSSETRKQNLFSSFHTRSDLE